MGSPWAAGRFGGGPARYPGLVGWWRSARRPGRPGHSVRPGPAV